MLTKTQMKHEIVGQSALSLLASGIRFMEIPQLYPTFDNVFEHAFKECGLDRVYPACPWAELFGSARFG